MSDCYYHVKKNSCKETTIYTLVESTPILIVSPRTALTFIWMWQMMLRVWHSWIKILIRKIGNTICLSMLRSLKVKEYHHHPSLLEPQTVPEKISCLVFGGPLFLIFYICRTSWEPNEPSTRVFTNQSRTFQITSVIAAGDLFLWLLQNGMN